jgi:hypothetical protein
MKFRKKPVVVEAEQWVPGKQVDGVQKYEHPGDSRIERIMMDALPIGADPDNYGYIETLEGGHIVTAGDWIITGVHGEKYPCKPDIFEKTYELVEEEVPYEVREQRLFSETDWDSFPALWRDMKRFAKEHPDHEFIPADNPEFRRFGWIAARNDPEDEQMKVWTIKVSHLLDRAIALALPEDVQEALKTANGRIEMLKRLRE